MQYRDLKEREIKKWNRTSLRCGLEGEVSMVDNPFLFTLVFCYLEDLVVQ